jgi:hypothetical protein
MQIQIVLDTQPSTYETVELTCDHSSSSYGMPVLLIDGIAYGPADEIPGRFLACRSAGLAVHGAQNFGLVTEAQWPTIERFLSTWHPTATPKTYSDEQRKADQASLDSLFED